MSLNKVNYVNNSTTITAENLNEIQDAILENEKAIKKKVESSELTSAVNSALEQAKESGEFDGSKGEPGKGIKSVVLNADYTLSLTFDDGTVYTTPSIRGASGKDGEDGENGTDGVGIASIEQTTTSTVDGGNNVFTVTLTNGVSATFTVKNGNKGKDGENGKSAYQYARDDGYTGTEAEFAKKLAQDVVISLTKAEYLVLTPEDIANCYNNGVRVIIVEDGYTNLVPTAIGENGAVYYGCGYLNEYRLTSKGEVSGAQGCCLSGYMEYSHNSTIRVVGSGAIVSAGGQYVAVYDASFNLIDIDYFSDLASYGSYVPRTDGMYELTIDTSKISAWSTAKYFRVSCANCVGVDLIITIDEEI